MQEESQIQPLIARDQVAQIQVPNLLLVLQAQLLQLKDQIILQEIALGAH